MAHFATLEAKKVNNEVNSNSLDGLDSLVVDSAMVNKAQCDIEKNLVPNAMSDQKQDGNINVLPLIEPLEIDSRNYPRASQIEGINLLVDLHPAEQRKRIRTQVYEACMSSWESESIQNSTLSVKARQEQELQSTILAGEILGVNVVEGDIISLKKMIETEAKEYALLQRNTSAC